MESFFTYNVHYALLGVVKERKYNGLIISSDGKQKSAFSTAKTKISGRHDIKMDLVERAA